MSWLDINFSDFLSGEALAAQCSALRFFELYEEDRQAEAINAAITNASRASALLRFANGSSPPNSDGYNAIRLTLGYYYFCRFQDTAAHLRDDGDLENAVELQTDVVRCLQDDHPWKAAALSDLADSLQQEFERYQDSKDLKEAIECSVGALNLLRSFPYNYPLKVEVHLRLASRSLAISEVWDLPQFVTLAIYCLQILVDNTTDEDPRVAGWLDYLASVRITQFLANPSDHRGSLQFAILSLRRALPLVPPDSERALFISYALEGAEDLMRNPARRQVFPSEPDDLVSSSSESQDPHDILHHTERLLKSGRPEDIDIAMQNCERVVKAQQGTYFVKLKHIYDPEDLLLPCPHGCCNGERSSEPRLADHGVPEFELGVWRKLASAMKSRYVQQGDIRSLDGAVLALRRTVGLSPFNETEMRNAEGLATVASAIHIRKTHAYSLWQLSYVLRLRHERLRSLWDLHESVILARHAFEVKPIPLSAQYYAECLAVQCTVTAKENSRDVKIAVEAVKYARLADCLTSNSDPLKSRVLMTLARALPLLFPPAGPAHRSDFDEIISAVERASTLQPDHISTRRLILSAKGQSYSGRFYWFHDRQDIETAISAFNEALACSQNEVVFSADILQSLTISTRWRFDTFPNLDNLMEEHYAMSNAIQAWGPVTFGRVDSAIEHAKRCVQYHEFDESYRVTMEAHQMVFASIPSAVWMGQSIADRFEELSRRKIGLAITAAVATAITINLNGLALQWLEEGRSIVWGQLTRLRVSLDELKIVDSVLAEKLLDVSTKLDEATNTFEEYELELMRRYGPFQLANLCERESVETKARNHHRLAAEYQELLDQVREIPRFSGFLRAKTFPELAPAARDGPVVIINVDQSRCDALVLWPGGNLDHVPLPRLTLNTAQVLRSQLVESICHRRDRNALRDDERGIDPDQPDSTMHIALRALCQFVVDPILGAIRVELEASCPAGMLPHVTWCTTGPLVSLPLHAAAVLGPAPFEFVSSYAPSLSALVTAQSAPTPTWSSVNEPRLLVVAQPGTPGKSPLPHTVAEAQAVYSHYGSNTTCLIDQRASVDAVFNAMETHDWVHLACHAAQDASNPTGSAFFLHDGQLALSRLMARNRGRELAVLSACQTAKGDDNLPEEAAHLAAGMLAAGYKSVVATLWSIQDKDGPTLSDELYKEMKRNILVSGRPHVAHALHKATAVLRQKVGLHNVARWAPFVHFGV